MTVRIQREFSFQAGVYFKDAFSMNLYTFSLYMNVDTESIREQNIAMDRIKYFLAECLENSIFLEGSEKKAIDKYAGCGFKVCTLPEEPYDQIISMALLFKLNAITEGRLLITNITLNSRLSDNVKFLYDIDSPEGPFDTMGWWKNSSTLTATIKSPSKKDKIVQLFKPNDWNDINLLWKEKDITGNTEIAFMPDHTT